MSAIADKIQRGGGNSVAYKESLRVGNRRGADIKRAPIEFEATERIGSAQQISFHDTSIELVRAAANVEGGVLGCIGHAQCAAVHNRTVVRAGGVYADSECRGDH